VGVIVFVPTHLARLHLRRKLALAGLPLCNVHFLTLDGFVIGAVPEVGGPRYLSPQAAAVLASDIAEAALEATYFGQVRCLHGFHHALLATIFDLKEAGLEPDDLRACFAQEVPSPLREKLDAILKFWQAYEARKAELGEGDLPDLYAYVIDHLDDVPLIKGVSHCFFYGYYDFKGVQYRLVEAIVSRRPCSFYVPVNTHDPVGEYVRPAVESLTEDLGCGEQEVGRPEHAGGRLTALQRLQDDLFAEVTGQRPSASDTSVRILSLPTDATEPDHVVRLVADALADGRPGHAVAIITRTSAQAYPYIVALDAHGIELADVTQVPLSATATGTAIMTLLELASEPEASRRFPRQAVLRLLEAASGLLGEDAEWPRYLAEFDAITRHGAIVSGKDEWTKGLERVRRMLHQEAESGEGLKGISDEAVDKLKRIAGGLFSALESLVDANSWRDAVASLTRALQILFEGGHKLPKEVRAFLKALKELEPYVRCFKLPLFLTAAREHLDAVAEQRNRPDYMEGGVVVTDVMSARGARFDVVILPGVAERQVPLPYRQDPILLDEEREWINRALRLHPPIMQLPLRRRRAHEERLLFKLAIDSADQAVVLTFSRLETGTARPILPSPYLLDVLRVFGVETPTYRAFHEQRPLPCVSYVAHRAADASAWALSKTDFLRRKVVRAAQKLSAAGVDHIPWAAAASVNPVLERALRAERKRWRTQKHTEYEGQLVDQNRIAVLANQLMRNGELTVSMLDDYDWCHYAFLLRHGLRLDEEPDPIREYRISPARLGSIAHRILHRTFERFPNPPDAVDDLLHALREEAEAAFNEAESFGAIGFPVLWRWEKKRLVQHLETLVGLEYERLLEEGRWVWRCEQPVGQSLGGVSLADGKRIVVRGRIDRIDRGKDGTWHIVDYKASKGASVDNQLIAYAAVAAQECPDELPPSRFGSIEACYYRVSGRGNYFQAQSGELSELQGQLERITAQLIEGVQKGDFRQMPNKQVCPACTFSEVCMNLQFVIARIKGTPPTGSASG